MELNFSLNKTTYGAVTWVSQFIAYIQRVHFAVKLKKAFSLFQLVKLPVWVILDVLSLFLMYLAQLYCCNWMCNILGVVVFDTFTVLRCDFCVFIAFYKFLYLVKVSLNRYIVKLRTVFATTLQLHEHRGQNNIKRHISYIL